MREACHYLQDRRCGKKLHADRRIGQGVCDRCDSWEAVDASKPVAVRVVKTKAGPDEVTICAGQLHKFKLEGRDILVAGRVAVLPTGGLIVPRAVYDAAMKYRR